MQPTSHFDASAINRLRGLISDLRWRLRLIDADIQEEERKAGISEPTKPTYPMLALALRERRDNLLATVGMLQRQLDMMASSADWTRAA